MSAAIAAPPARAGGEAPRPRLYNMSAPPRATLTFRPLRMPGADGRESPVAGFRFVCRIDVVGYFWPASPGVPRDPAEDILWEQTLEPQRRLLAQALAEERGRSTPDSALAVRVGTMPADAVLEGLREVALRTDCIALGLPVFGLLRPAVAARRRRRVPMRVAVAVLARRRGGVFLREADPLVPSAVTRAFDLWTPQEAER
jgi:hypothetical protein